MVGWTAYFSYATRPSDIFTYEIDGIEYISDHYGQYFDLHESISPLSLNVPYERSWSAVQINSTIPINVSVYAFATTRLLESYNNTMSTGVLNYTGQVYLELSTDSDEIIQVHALFWWLHEIVFYHWELQYPWGQIMLHVASFGFVLIAFIDILFLMGLTFATQHMIDDAEYDEEEEEYD
jgi:hypothetical protein